MATSDKSGERTRVRTRRIRLHWKWTSSSVLGCIQAARFVLAQGSVYPALRSLERDGLLWAYVSAGKIGTPRIRYGLTEAGVKVAAAYRAAVGALYGFST